MYISLINMQHIFVWLYAHDIFFLADHVQIGGTIISHRFVIVAILLPNPKLDLTQTSPKDRR